MKPREARAVVSAPKIESAVVASSEMHAAAGGVVTPGGTLSTLCGLSVKKAVPATRVNMTGLGPCVACWGDGLLPALPA